MKYIDSLGNSDGEISIQELENSVRNCRRGKSAAKEYAKGRLLMYRLEEIIEKKGWSIKNWFDDCKISRNDAEGDTEDDYHDGRVSMTRIHHELLTVHKGTDCEELDEEGTEHIVHYLDPHFHGFITFLEIRDAFKRSKLAPDALLVEFNCSLIMTKLEDWMIARRLRIIDLFRKLDTDASGYISTKEFQAGVEKFIGLEKNLDEVEISVLMIETNKDIVVELGGQGGKFKEGNIKEVREGDEDDLSEDSNKSDSDDDDDGATKTTPLNSATATSNKDNSDISQTRRLKHANSVI